MNLSNVKSSEQILSTIAVVTTTASSSSHDADMIKSILKTKLTSSTPAPQISPIIAPPSIEQKPEEHQFIYCKKVRQAQQMKMTANLNSTIVSSQQYQNDLLTVPRNPPDRKFKRDSNLVRKAKDDSQTSQAGGESSDIALKKDELQPLKEDFILPRERFISICNMDRNALDTYLNDSEENSQDLELLQYFDDDKNKPNEDSIEEDLGPATTSVPLLENYQLNFNDNKSDKQEKINQLRTILEEKHSTSSAGMTMESPAIKNLLLKDQPLLMESPAILNPFSMQQIQKHDQQLTQNYPTIDDKSVPQSPNTRRKNFSFVPISTQSRVVKNVNLMPAFSSTNNNNNNNNNARQDSFVSPRVTPNNDRRPQQQLLNIRSPGSMSLEVQKTLTNNSTIPALGVNTAFCRPSQFKIEPLSAPPSPSTQFNYSPQAQHPHQQHPQNQFQFQNLTPQSAQVQGEN